MSRRRTLLFLLLTFATQQTKHETLSLEDAEKKAKKKRDYRPMSEPISSLSAFQKQKPKILVADKNPVVRSGLADLISVDGRFECVPTVATGAAFLSACTDGSIDIGLIGWALPDMTGGDVLEVLKRRQIKTRVVIYTGEAVTDVLRQTIKSGGWGFLSKSDEPSLILETLWTVARGRLCFPYVDLETLSQDPLERLTSRERELLAALANGWSNLQIASRIGISPNTVKYHLKNLYDKLGVNNRASAVALFLSRS